MTSRFAHSVGQGNGRLAWRLGAFVTAVSLCATAVALAATDGASFRDPFAYCAAVGTADRPDARWTGPKLPDTILNGLVSLGLVMPNVPPEMSRHATWRCMDGEVWVCSYGANIPCDEKADTSREPGIGMQRFCQQKPSSDFIPAYVTGRATIYAWRCEEGEAVVERELTQPDARGFLSSPWHQLPPPTR